MGAVIVILKMIEKIITDRGPPILNSPPNDQTFLNAIV